jgi:hypothetical protein
MELGGTAKSEVEKCFERHRPSINFGRVIIKNTKTRMHGGMYDDRDYYVEVINDVPNTVAINCKGFLDMQNGEIRRHTTVWEDWSETTNIGHTIRFFTYSMSLHSKKNQKGGAHPSIFLGRTA